jgi:pSer/pThr/pTyr-binding forkhead associated (FHA) protein
MPRVTITVPEKNAQPYRFQLDRQLVTLGRGSESDIVIESGSVSVKHAQMLRVDGGYELRDVGSTNGIKLDGERHDVIPLRHGMTVKLGDVAFDFQLTDDEREALKREKPMSDSPIIKERPVPTRSGQLEARPQLPPAPPRQAAAVATPVNRPPARPPLNTGSSGGGFVMVMVFIILAASAFFAGLAIRHQKETGTPLIDAIGKRSDPPPAPDPAPAATPDAE